MEPFKSTPRLEERLLSDIQYDGASQLKRSPSLWVRIGRTSLALLCLSLLACVASIAFLTFLWKANETNSIWREITLANWTTRSITITALVLRWATTVQAVTCTSMLAAVLIEACAVSLYDSAAIGLMRFENTGPLLLLRRAGNRFNSRSVLVLIPTLLLFLTTTAVQFSSTILLSQVSQGSIPMEFSNSTLFSYSDNSVGAQMQISSTNQFTARTPNGFPAFAEWSPNLTESVLSGPDRLFARVRQPGIVDTGTVMRAFIPISDPDKRSQTVSYQGSATVVDTRVVCMLPKLTNLVFTSDSGYLLEGVITTEQRPSGFLQDPDSTGRYEYSLNISCGFAAGSGSTTKWPVTLCNQLSPSTQSAPKQGIYSAMEPVGREEITRTFVLLNATSTENFTTSDGSDFWTSFSLASADSSIGNKVTFQASLCMTSFMAQNLQIDATRTVPVPDEPVLTWDAIGGDYVFDAANRQLGLKNESIAERGIFNLGSRSWVWQNRPQYVDITGGALSTTAGIDFFPQRIYSGFINDIQDSFFSRVIASTANPALALQSWFTMLMSICYHDALIKFDDVAPSTQQLLVPVIRPNGWTAYAIVVGLVALHLVLVSATIVVFASYGKHTILDNAWAAISQGSSGSAENWARQASLVEDKTIKKMMRARGLHDQPVRLEQKHGVVELVDDYKLD